MRWNKPLAVAAVLSGSLALSTPAWANVLEDTLPGVWRIQAQPDHATAERGSPPFATLALFHDGKFTAEAFGGFGFAPRVYSTWDSDGVTAFSAVLTSPDRGELIFEGKQYTDVISGELTWRHPDGTTLRFILEGRRDQSGTAEVEEDDDN